MVSGCLKDVQKPNISVYIKKNLNMRNHRKTAKVKPKQCMEDTEAITKQQKERNEKQ